MLSSQNLHNSALAAPCNVALALLLHLQVVEVLRGPLAASGGGSKGSHGSGGSDVKGLLGKGGGVLMLSSPFMSQAWHKFTFAPMPLCNTHNTTSGHV